MVTTIHRALLIGIFLATPVLGQQAAPDFSKELEELKAAYSQAEEQHFKPVRAAETDEERQKVWSSLGAHPVEEFIPKFLDLAERAKGTPAEFPALMEVIQLRSRSMSADTDFTPVETAIDRILEGYVDSPDLEVLVPRLEHAGWSMGYGRTISALETILEKTPQPKVRAAARFTLATALLQDPSSEEADEKRARQLLEETSKDFSAGRYAKRAHGFLFELDNLQIGMVAPDFEAVDQDGVSFKLSDYRGKVVVVDFWGFW